MLLTFGEIMLRLAPEGHWRFRQALPGRLEASFAGAEANVAAVSTLLGAPARFLTALPGHALAECVTANLRAVGMEVSAVRQTAAGRLGIFFSESGANQRASQVIYDREHSAFALCPAATFDFAAALNGVTWVHTTGITPALGENAFRNALALLEAAKARGITVSLDLNFRKKLWQWEPGTPPAQLAGRCLDRLVRLADLLIANEEDAGDVFGIRPRDDTGGQREKNRTPAHYATVAARLCERFPNLKMTAITLRESVSATFNRWGAALFLHRDGKTLAAPAGPDGRYRPYEISAIVDRVGAGDAFAGALVYALMSPCYAEPETALRFATAASCLKHSVLHDFALLSEKEIVALMNQEASGRIDR